MKGDFLRELAVSLVVDDVVDKSWKRSLIVSEEAEHLLRVSISAAQAF